jgi:tetratricopeptide (TPR) repeat protein
VGGGTTRDEQVPLGRLTSAAVLRGMSGAPVRRVADDVVVGVVSGRYNSADGWLRDSVWVARTESLQPLLTGVAEVAVGGQLPLGEVVELVLTVSGTHVRLCGAGVDVSAAHGGVRPGLAAAIHDVRRARARTPNDVRTGTDAEPSQVPAVEMSLRRAGELTAESFLPGPVGEALRDALVRAEAEHVPVRIGIAASRLAWLPWEALPVPGSGRPLALHPLVTVYRELPTGPVRAVPGPLRIVVTIAAPDNGGGAVLDYERELRNVIAAVRSARAGQAQVRVVAFASTAAIRAALAEEPAHVLHLSGHGEPGTLILEDDQGEARAVDADTFLEEAIPAGAMPPVISLAACYTAAPSGADSVSFAARLAERGASVVIGTETSVTDRYATQLFARVYAELAASPVPDAVRAVADARRAIQHHLSTSPDKRDRELAELDEWSVVTVQAASGSVRVFDPAIVEFPDRPGSRSVGGLLAREVGEFVGRRREQRRLPHELLSTGTAGVVLQGLGGVGKTTLAAEITRRIRDLEPTRVVLIGELSIDGVLADVTAALHRQLLLTGAPELTLRVVQAARRVDLPWQDRFALLRDHVLDQLPLLVVLDNFEDNLTQGHAEKGREVRDPVLGGLLAEWVRAPGRSRLLVTCQYEFALPQAAHDHLMFCHLGPLSLAETLKLIWSLPALDRLEEPELERVWRMVGGHPRTLEYLDALLRGGSGRYHDVTARLTRAVHAKLGKQKGDRWLATAKTLDTALAESLTLAADDVLLGELFSDLTPPAQQLLVGASVYREPVDTNALLFQLGDPDDAAGHTPDRRGAMQQVQDILAARHLTVDDLAKPGDLPPDVAAELAPHLRELATPPTPPRATPLDLAHLTDLLAGTSLLTVNPEQGTVVVHRWTATELEQRLHEQGRGAEIQQAHEHAAEYWQWRVEKWPQDSHADLHDRIEARHHLLAARNVDQAVTITEDICAQLHQWGSWDYETTLIHDTLTRLPPDSPRRSAWIHQLGMLAHLRGDYKEAERRYQQSLTIDERLGNQAGMATSWSQLGILHSAAHQYADAIAWHIRALFTRARLQVPQMVIDARALVGIRTQIWNQSFVEMATNIIDDSELAELQTLLDTVQTASSGNEAEEG